MGEIPEEFINISIELSHAVILTAEKRQLMPETA